MKRGAVRGIGVLAWVLGMALQLYEPIPLQIFSHQIEDILRRMIAEPVQNKRIVILDIDEESLRKMGQWPWPRAVLANLVERLWQEGAAIVAWDILFAEPDRTSPSYLLARWREAYGEVVLRGVPHEHADYDELFAKAISHGPTVLGMYGELKSRNGPMRKTAPPPLPRREGSFYEKGHPDHSRIPTALYCVQPIECIRRAARSEAFFNTFTDADNVVRQTPLIMACGEELYPALALEVFRFLNGAKSVGIIWDSDTWRGIAGLRVGPHLLSTDGHGCLFLNYRSTPFPRVSVAAWLAGEAELGFSNCVVFVGSSAAGLRDLVGTPMGPDVPGVEVHATALDNMLAGDPLRKPRWMFGAKMLATFCLGLLLVYVLARVRAVSGFVWIACLLIGGVVTSWYLLVRGGWLVSPGEYMLSMALIYVAMTTVKYGVEESEKRKIRRVFGPMVSADVLRYLETHSEEVAMTGRRVEATVFFSDITHFTALAERLPPEDLTSWMNRYFTLMAETIMEEGGYVDKFNGDAIMAVWGVPFPSKDHAFRACKAALKQQQRLKPFQEELNARFGVAFRVRMGVNTGSMTAGNMGSARRHQYTVMGDAVNVAARLQEANKEWGTTILIGEETWRRVSDRMICRPLGKVSLRGREHPIEVYELLGNRASTPDIETDSK